MDAGSRKTLIISAAVVVVALVVGYYGGRYSEQRFVESLVSDRPVEKSPPQTLALLQGTVKSVGVSSLVIEAAAGAATVEKTITVTSATSITKQGAPKDKTAYDKEVAAFTAALAKNPANETLIAPDYFTQTAIPLAAVRTGDSVAIFTKDMQAASNVSIEAASIRVVTGEQGTIPPPGQTASTTRQ